MGAKQVLFDAEARGAVKRGVEKIFNAVRLTLGPRGRSVVIDKSWGSPNITKDGASIAEEVELEDPNEDMGAKMIKEAASKTGDDAGDGTTTSVVLASSMFLEGHKVITAGANAIEISRGIRRATSVVADAVRKLAEKITVGDRKRITQVARIASGGNDDVGNMLAEAFEKVGKEGAISVEEGKGIETQIKIVEGMQFDRGFLSPHFVTNQESVEAILEKAYVLIYEDKLSSAAPLIPLLEKIAAEKRALLVIAEDVEADALATLVVNKLRGILHVCAVKAPGYGDRRKAMLEDLAILTAGRAIFKDLGVKLESVKVADLGRADKVIVDTDNTTIIQGAGAKDTVKQRCEQIRREMEQTDSDYDREKLQERLSKLSGGVAQINVGASTETELKERKKQVENALAAVRAALEDGIAPGGGVALLRAQRALDKLETKSGDEKFGVDIVRRALEAPLRQIAENSGLDPSIAVRHVREGATWYGLDAVSATFTDLLKAGIVDPVKVTCHAIQNAGSVASMLLTTEALVSEIREKEKKEAPGMPGAPGMSGMPGGMPGMPGM